MNLYCTPYPQTLRNKRKRLWKMNQPFLSAWSTFVFFLQYFERNISAWSAQGPVYTKRQSQRCNNSVITLAILLRLKTMESLQNGVAIHFRVTPLFSMRTVSLASSQSCCSIDNDAWSKGALTDTLMQSSRWDVYVPWALDRSNMFLSRPTETKSRPSLDLRWSWRNLCIIIRL